MLRLSSEWLEKEEEIEHSLQNKHLNKKMCFPKFSTSGLFFSKHGGREQNVEEILSAHTGMLVST